MNIERITKWLRKLFKAGSKTAPGWRALIEDKTAEAHSAELPEYLRESYRNWYLEQDKDQPWIHTLKVKKGQASKPIEYIDPPVHDVYPLPSPPPKYEFITEEEIPLSDRDKWNTYVKEIRDDEEKQKKIT